MGFGRPMTYGSKRVVPMCHILAIASIQNQITTYEHHDKSYIMQQCQNSDINDIHIYAKNMYRGLKALESPWMA